MHEIRTGCLVSLATLLLIPFITSTNGQSIDNQMPTRSKSPVFEYLQHFKLENVWDDRGSGATLDGSFWRPISLPPGYHYVGHYAKAGYEISASTDYIQLLHDLYPKMANLKPPKELVWVYDDSKTGANRNVTVVSAVPYDGYTCIGLLAFPMHRMPRVEDFPGYACVRSEFVVPTRVGEQIWNDRKSGGRHDFSAWRISNGSRSLYTGTFVGHRSYEVYKGAVYAVRLDAASLSNSLVFEYLQHFVDKIDILFDESL